MKKKLNNLRNRNTTLIGRNLIRKKYGISNFVYSLSMNVALLTISKEVQSNLKGELKRMDYPISSDHSIIEFSYR